MADAKFLENYKCHDTIKCIHDNMFGKTFEKILMYYNNTFLYHMCLIPWFIAIVQTLWSYVS